MLALSYENSTTKAIRVAPLSVKIPFKIFPHFAPWNIILLEMFSSLKHTKKISKWICQEKFIHKWATFMFRVCSFSQFHIPFCHIFFINRARGFIKSEFSARWKTRIKEMSDENEACVQLFRLFILLRFSSSWIWEIVERTPRYFNNN